MKNEEVLNQLPEIEKCFFRFWNKLTTISIQGEKVYAALSDALIQVCPILHISKIEVMINAPANRVYPEGVSGRRLLYSDGVADVFHPLTEEFTTEEGGDVRFELFWARGSKQNEEVLFWAYQVIQVLYMFLGRARISKMLHLSMKTDHTTGLPNLSVYLHRIEELIQMGRIMDYAAVFFNIRNFKYINTIVSNYQDGDGIMRQYTAKATALLESDEIMARLGGDNYVVLVRKNRLDLFLDKLDEIVVNVATAGGVKRIPLTARCGIYLIDRPIAHAGEIMMPISVAQQIARESGRGQRVYYDRNMSREVLNEKKVALDFGRGLEEGQFHAYYQPKIDLENGRLCGAEALARWEIKGEVVPPARFVPILEKDGTICRLDFEILRQACEMLSKWRQRGAALIPVSVNMSRWHLKDADFVDDLIKIVENSGIEPKWIEIEVTETVDYEEYQTMLEILVELKKRGFSTSIDDFGSGYSSLTMLHKMDVDVLKLDQSFLWDSGKKRDILVRNVIRMAKELGIKVLAEGVETIQHRDFLIANGCDMAQGYYYAMPLRQDEFEKRAFS